MCTAWKRKSITPSMAEFLPLLDWLYAVPVSLRSYEQWMQREHRDLDDRTRTELVIERSRLRARLRLDGEPDAWLYERLDALEEGIRRAR